MNFVDDHVLLKSNWFDKGGLISKTNCNVLLLYLILYKFRIHNQEHEHMFLTSMKMLKKETGFTLEKTYELFKLLIRHKIISCDVTRWDRYTDNEIMTVKSLEFPKTERIQNKDEEWQDKPLSEDDQYVSVDLKLMQYYLDLGLSGEEIALYCLLKKGRNKTEGKTLWSIDTMSQMLGLSKDKVHKIIMKLNRLYLLASVLKVSGSKVVQGKSVRVYKYEHYIFPRFNDLEEYRSSWLKDVIEGNIKRWDGSKGKKGNGRTRGKRKNSGIDEIDESVNELELVFDD